MARAKQVVVKFEETITVKGVEVAEITLHRPKVKDMKRASEYSKNEAAQEIWLVSSLTGIPLSDIENLDLEDYETIQSELGNFRKSQR